MNEPLDEIQWSLPSNIVHYQFGGIHTNSVHKYFMASTFFDDTSNNAIIRAQTRFETQHILDNRKLFEDRLRQMSGVEFMIVQEPTVLPEGGDTGVWIIRKQERQKRPNGGNVILTVLGTYFVVGEHIYQSPSISNILQSRLLTITTTLTKMMSLTSSMSQFSLSDGHYYLSKTQSAGIQQNQTSQATGPGDTPAPDGGPSASGQQPKRSQTAAQEDTHMLFDSLNMFHRYKSEFMDENPLQGEPGSLIFTSTNQHIQARQAKAEAEAAALQAMRASGLGAGKQKNPLIAAAASAAAGGSGGPTSGGAGGGPTADGRNTKRTKSLTKLLVAGPRAKKKKARLSSSASAAATPKSSA